MERSKNSRSRSVPGSHPHAGRNPTENECGGIHRISQREKQFDDFSTTRESEVQIWESVILAQRGTTWTRRKEYEKDRGIHSKSVERRSTYRSDDVTLCDKYSDRHTICIHGKVNLGIEPPFVRLMS